MRFLNIALASCMSIAIAQGAHVIIDSDWGANGYVPLLIALNDPNSTVVGLTTLSGDTWMDQSTQYALRWLEIANRTSVPVAKGATFPVYRTETEFTSFQNSYGNYAWSGAFHPQNKTSEDMGKDPTGNSTYASRTTKLPEGEPTTKPVNTSAAQFLIDQANLYPGDLTIVAIGPLTNMLLAQTIDPSFPSKVANVVYQGGYINWNLQQLTGALIADDVWTDFNSIFDPESAATVVRHPGYKKITLVGDVADLQFIPNAAKSAISSSTRQTFFTSQVSNFEFQLPSWDETATAVALYPDLINSTVKAYFDFDVSHGPHYGRGVAYPFKGGFQPKGLRVVDVVLSIHEERFWDIYAKAVTAFPK